MLKEILKEEEEEIIKVLENEMEGILLMDSAARFDLCERIMSAEGQLKRTIKKYNQKIIEAVREEEKEKSEKFKDKVELVFSQLQALEESNDIFFTKKAKKMLDDFIKTHQVKKFNGKKWVKNSKKLKRKKLANKKPKMSILGS